MSSIPGILLLLVQHFQLDAKARGERSIAPWLRSEDIDNQDRCKVKPRAALSLDKAVLTGYSEAENRMQTKILRPVVETTRRFLCRCTNSE
jgi:hypothetical protein